MSGVRDNENRNGIAFGQQLLRFAARRSDKGRVGPAAGSQSEARGPFPGAGNVRFVNRQSDFAGNIAVVCIGDDNVDVVQFLELVRGYALMCRARRIVSDSVRERYAPYLPGGVPAYGAARFPDTIIVLLRTGYDCQMKLFRSRRGGRGRQPGAASD